jgi:heme a synthase
MIRRPRPLALSNWLFLVTFMVFLMVVIGGITRLTESGLSITRWEPVSGIIPPLSETAWQAEFDAYKATPEYQQINRGMSIAAFKAIYFWEYLHRALGRLIGLVVAIPLAWFALTRAIPRGYGPPLTALLALGGLQGFIGWWMVKSGLVDRTDVSHFRLATHLGTALVIMGFALWLALSLRDKARPRLPVGNRPRGWIIPYFLLLGAQIKFGAFVAGLNAGYAFNTWPMMGEDWIAPHVMQSVGASLGSLINDAITVQFVHRWLAVLVALYALHIAGKLWRYRVVLPSLALGLTVIGQFALGVATLVNGVPIWLGVAHQAGGALLVGTSVWAAHRVTRPH